MRLRIVPVIRSVYHRLQHYFWGGGGSGRRRRCCRGFLLLFLAEDVVVDFVDVVDVLGAVVVFR